jgi:hypothetical protein
MVPPLGTVAIRTEHGGRSRHHRGLGLWPYRVRRRVTIVRFWRPRGIEVISARVDLPSDNASVDACAGIGSGPIMMEGPAFAESPYGRFRPKSGKSITSIRLERGPCYGMCPVYSATLRRDGTAQYRGEEHVSRTGPHVGQLDETHFEFLAAAVEELGFFDLADSYAEPVTDQATATTTVVRSRRRTRVSNYGNAGPWQLWAVEMLIDAVAETVEWRPSAR